MADYKALIVGTLASILTLTPLAGTRVAAQEQSRGRAYYAAVFLNRGHVTGGTQSNIGLFRRSLGDTVWTNIYRKNLLSFGLGFWEGASGKRYYLAAGNGLHRSMDGMKSWRVLTDWHTEEILSVAPDPVDSSIIYVSTPFGVFKSVDEGRHWEKKMNGMKKWFVKKVLFDVTDRTRLYAIGEEDVYHSTDGGEHWTALGTGLGDVQAFAQNPKSPGNLLAGGEDNGIKVTLDAGKSWQAVGGIPKESFYSIAFSPDGRTAFAGGFKTGFWMSADNGVSWTLLWQDKEIEAIAAIFIEQQNPGHMLIGTTGQGVYESLDAGTTWRSAGLKGCQVRQIELYP
jgi:photosystem II stability/assembly factor-like uncharacterized protein